MTARVAWISLTPVKGLALEHVEQVELLESGLRGDRRFYLVDRKNRLVNNKGRRRCALEVVHSRFDEDANELTLRFADDREISGATEPGEELQTVFHKRPKTARAVAGPWDDALSEVVQEPVRLVVAKSGAPDRGRGGAVTLLASASLDALAAELDVPALDRRRFRMNFGVDGIAAHEEDEWVGKRLSIGEAVVVPQGHVGRCAITTQNPDTGLPDLNTLRALAGYRGDLDATEPLPFGIHAAVAQPGRIRVGDPVQLL